MERGFRWAAGEWIRLADEHGQLTGDIIKAEDKTEAEPETMAEASSTLIEKSAPDLGGKGGEGHDDHSPSGSTAKEEIPASSAITEDEQGIRN